ncbi:MAG: cytochrome c biogenesis CcdA family protein [Deinococcales bacterium]
MRFAPIVFAYVLCSSVVFAQGSETLPPGVLAAFLAGLISFLSPCVLPLVPSYLAVLGGGTGKKPIIGALLFVLGFTLVFVSFGAGASALGSLMRQNRDLLAQIGGVLIFVFGVVFLIKDRVPFLNREYRADLGTASRFGLVALGAAFGAGWTPCIGPILGVILSIAGSSGSLSTGVGLLLVYSLGLAVPFLLAALAWDRLGGRFRQMGRYVGIVEKVSGVLLILAGVLLASGNYAELGRYLQSITPQWLLDLERGLK